MSKYDEYAEIIGEKFDRGLIDEDRFYFLLMKIGEWEREELYGGEYS